MRSIVALSIIAIIAIGCANIVDKRGDSDVCKVHNVKMRAVTIPKVLVLGDTFDSNYNNARESSFPNVYPVAVTVSKHEMETIYVCDECLRQQKLWLEPFMR
jgi:hypothetical protein